MSDISYVGCALVLEYYLASKRILSPFELQREKDAIVEPLLLSPSQSVQPYTNDAIFKLLSAKRKKSKQDSMAGLANGQIYMYSTSSYKVGAEKRGLYQPVAPRGP